MIHPDAPCIYVLYCPTKEFDNAQCTGAVQQHDQCWRLICLVEFAIVNFNATSSMFGVIFGTPALLFRSLSSLWSC